MKKYSNYALFFLIEAIGFWAGYQWRERYEPIPIQSVQPAKDSTPIKHGPSWPKTDKYGHWEAEKG